MEQLEARSKKRYDLSLKRDNRLPMNNNDKDLRMFEALKVCDESLDFTDSQNIELRVSDSFLVQDTQEREKHDVDRICYDKEEVILISDSSEDESSKGYEWARSKTSNFERRRSASPFGPTYTIPSSGSEEESRSRGNDSSQGNPFRNHSSMYTSDDTFNKENTSRSQTKRSEYKIVPDSDESMFSIDNRRILTDNRANVDSAISFRNLAETNHRAKEGWNGPSNRAPGDKTERSDAQKETNRRIEEWRRTPEFANVSTRRNESPNNAKEIQRRIGSADKLKETSKRFEELEITPRSKNFRNESGSLNNIRGVHRTIENQDDQRGIGKSSEKSRKTPQSLKTLDKDGVISRAQEETPGQTGEARTKLLSSKKSSARTVLSKKDVQKILEVVKSKRAVYQLPEDYKRPRNSDDSEVDNDESSIDSKENSKNVPRKEKPIVIAETDSDSEDEIIRGSKVDLSKPYKTHVTRFLDPTTNYGTPDDASARKHLEIAHWLMTNSPAATCESSISNISASNKHSLSSGNSSLERLEMEYETPNNRDRIRKLRADEKSKYNQLNLTKSKQTTIDHFLKRSEDGTRHILTPVPLETRKKVVSDDLGIEDCAGILDNLYGKAWRSKANDILPSTEPRKKNILLRNKGVQTERKANPRSKRATKSSDSSSKEDGFDTFVKNIKPNLNSTKKITKRPDRDHFIKDSSSSAESSGETTYLTALTNPRISNERKINNKLTPLAPNLQRAIEICDSETDEENEKLFDNRKILSFSEDEADSSTSEYDPDDIIPVKTTTKTTLRNLPKPTRIPVSVTNSRIPKTKMNFLASLSATVPLTEAHPDAKRYRQDFKNKKEELCKYLYKLYNEKIFDNKLPSDMSIEWNVRMRGTAGFCYNKRSIKALGGVTRSSRIVLATKILDTPDRLRDTLVHEMCHAAAWLINDVSDGHGPFWKGWAAKAMKAFPELPSIKRCHDYKIKTKFTYRCTGCGYSIGRHSKSLDVERKRCGHCYGKFELLINKVTKTGEVESKTPVSKKPSGFALFVKENYSTVKKQRRGVPHKEVMQILGQQFSAIKISKKNNYSDENNSVSGD